MALNFHVSVNKNSKKLHLELAGDFDGSSACELINNLQNGAARDDDIFIHIDTLNTIHPFGVDVFNNNLPARYKKSVNIVSSGQKINGMTLCRDHFLDY